MEEEEVVLNSMEIISNSITFNKLQQKMTKKEDNCIQKLFKRLHVPTKYLKMFINRTSH